MTAPFALPPGNVQIAFSGGRSSAMMLHHLIEANDGIPDRACVCFQNTGREMPETLDFVAQCGSRWGAPLVWLEYAPRRDLKPDELALVEQTFGSRYAARFAAWWSDRQNPSGFALVSHNRAARDGEPLLALVLHRKFLPNQAARFCTVETKVRTAKRYLMSLGWERWTNLCGMRADEPSRLKREQPKERWKADFPLANAGITKRDVASFWSRQAFDLRLPNVNGNCWLGNCDGCFLKSETNLAALARDYPDRHGWWENCEALATELTSGAAAHWSKRYTRRELRQFMDRQTDAFDVNDGQLCQADGGECFV